LALHAAGAETAKAARWGGGGGQARAPTRCGFGTGDLQRAETQKYHPASRRWPKDCTRSHIMADMRAGGSTETQPRTSSSHTCTSHCTPSRRRLTRYRRTGAGGTAGEAIVASDDNRLSGGAGVAAAADDVAVRHNQRPARRRCETTTRQSAATQVAQGTRDMAAISRWSGPMRHAKGGAQDGRARHIDFKGIRWVASGRTRLPDPRSA
jgi:hypothetical protein